MIDQLRQRREVLGLSQADVARAIGCDQRTISRWENGATSPTYGDLQRYASAIGAKLDTILVGLDINA